MSPADRTSDAPAAERLVVVIPCLNEAETLDEVIRAAREGLEACDVAGEVIVADNGSTDGSIEIAERLGARVVRVSRRGYGAALRGGIDAAEAEYVLMGDADASYDFREAPRFLAKLRDGCDLVMGDRFAGGIAPGAMPWKNRWIGNPLLSAIGRRVFRTTVRDFHCGLRALRKDAWARMDLRTEGMELASEMVIKASLAGMRIGEVPVTLSPDKRSRRPHLRPWRDGWRHLRFMLLFSPRWLFLYPGLAMLIVGIATGAWLLPGPRRADGVTFDVHSLLLAMVVALIGVQAIFFALFSRIYAMTAGLLPETARWRRLFRAVKLETGLLIGLPLTLVGLAGVLWAVLAWGAADFGDLVPSEFLRLLLPFCFLLLLGVQVVLSSFFLSVLGLARR